MKVFIVLVAEAGGDVNNFAIKNIKLESYWDLSVALKAACVAAFESNLFANSNPIPETTNDGRTIKRMVAADNSVAIFVLEQDVIPSTSMSTNFTVGGDLSGICYSQTVESIKNSPNLVKPMGLSLDDPYESSLPAGWDLNGKPIRMKDVLEDPENVINVWDLSEEQKRALVIARISKRSNYKYWSQFEDRFYSQKEAIEAIKSITGLSFDIVDTELDFLGEIITKAIVNTP